MFQWRKKRAPEKAKRCDCCDRIPVHRYAVSRGEVVYERCPDHQFTEREWAIISGRNDASSGPYETRGGAA